jgi:hypothetical protein
VGKAVTLLTRAYDPNHHANSSNVIPITRSCAPTYRRDFTYFVQLAPKGTNGALACSSKAIAVGAEGALLSGAVGQWDAIAEDCERIRVPNAETAKVLQVLVWGGFVT